MFCVRVSPHPGHPRTANVHHSELDLGLIEVVEVGGWQADVLLEEGVCVGPGEHPPGDGPRQALHEHEQQLGEGEGLRGHPSHAASRRQLAAVCPGLGLV